MALSIYRYIIHFLEDRHRPYGNIHIHIIYAHYKACEDSPCEPPKLSAKIKSFLGCNKFFEFIDFSRKIILKIKIFIFSKIFLENVCRLK
jgi:hypothetical protein